MPGITTVYNAKIQSSLNLNGQSLLNATNSKQYTPKYIGSASRTLNSSDIGCLLMFDVGGSLTLNSASWGTISAGDSLTVTFPSAYSIISLGVLILDCVDNTSTYNVLQLIYLGSNTWVQINAN